MLREKVSRRSFLTISAMTATSLALDWKKVSACAARMRPKESYPTVIIGAGLGGLCCGAYLARQGIPVTVVEQHNIPGGYATSFDRAAGKFTFEVSLHGTSINNNTAAHILKDIGVLDKIELAELPEFYCMKSPGREIISVPQRDPEAYISLLSRHFPNEEEGIRGFVQGMIAISDEAQRVGQENPTVKGVIYKLFFPFRYPSMWNVRNKTLADLLNDHVKDPSLQDVLAALWGYYGLPPSRLSGFYYAVATGGYLKNGSFYIKHRSQDLSYAIAETIENSGGHIMYETMAEKILIKDGAVQGVEVTGGKFLPARAVVSNASALTTFKEMLPQEAVPPYYLRRLEGSRPSLSTFLVWLGLNQELRDKINGSHIFVSSGQRPETDYKSIIKGEIDKAGFVVSIYDNVFEGYSRSGTSTLMITTLCGYEPWRKFESDYKAGQKDAYHREKERWADILIQRAEEQVVPGLSSMIEVKEAATPLTNWYYTRNTNGAIYGFDQSMDNSFMTRIDNRTPIEGLYLASAWGSPGGGFTGVLISGRWTFLKMMEDWSGWV